MNDTCFSLLKMAEEIQNLIYENIELKKKVSKLEEEVNSYHEFITDLNKKNMKIAGEVLKTLINKK